MKKQKKRWYVRLPPLLGVRKPHANISGRPEESLPRTRNQLRTIVRLPTVAAKSAETARLYRVGCLFWQQALHGSARYLLIENNAFFVIHCIMLDHHSLFGRSFNLPKVADEHHPTDGRRMDECTCGRPLRPALRKLQVAGDNGKTFADDKVNRSSAFQGRMTSTARCNESDQTYVVVCHSLRHSSTEDTTAGTSEKTSRSLASAQKSNRVD
ncbi:hypothetical protein RvY_07506 [Ramazzottius varieornatus]|uniref:Uncharacterized protein n=1 Tax=Ramazzottius varieornatus TaxID=947166 RepID=A0A1D1V5J2_RAMVA|nr:hypothetical protein RvY_07506 [Ramazzottius varieornatus]